MNVIPFPLRQNRISDAELGAALEWEGRAARYRCYLQRIGGEALVTRTDDGTDYFGVVMADQAGDADWLVSKEQGRWAVIEPFGGVVGMFDTVNAALDSICPGGR